MRINLNDALLQLERGKRMNREQIKEILESALLSAARKALGLTPERVSVICDEATGDMNVVVQKTVAAGRPSSPDEISLADSRRIKPDAEAGQEVTVQVPLDDPRLGRIAAQTAKHIMLQRIREVERESQFGEFRDKVGKVMTSLVKQRRGKLVILDLGDVEAVLPGNEQIPKEDYRPGEHLKALIAEVSNTPRGPHIIASRNRPELVKYLFEQEVPEVSQGIVEIKAVAREPGSRSKVAVISNDRNVDPVGACIGMKGMRVQSVVQELHGEKMDVVLWDEDPEVFLINALSPAKPSRVIKDEENRRMVAVAADHNQLVHLIGRGGQNARLAKKLTGWEVEVVTEADLRQPSADAAPATGETPETPAETAAVAPEADQAIPPEADQAVPPEGDTAVPPEGDRKGSPQADQAEGQPESPSAETDSSPAEGENSSPESREAVPETPPDMPAQAAEENAEPERPAEGSGAAS